MLINEQLLDEFRAMPCELCGRRPPSHAHHVLARGLEGEARLDHRFNLMALCLWCHARIHDGGILRSVCVAVVAAREGRTARFIQTKLMELRRV